jgi:DNA-binding transcriptional ArsR family regulator
MLSNFNINQDAEQTTSNPNNADKQFNSLLVKQAYLILKAINHKQRLDILYLLNKQEKLTVTDIFISLRLEQSIVSQHLRKLKSAKLVSSLRMGKNIYYFINKNVFNYYNELIHKLANLNETRAV